MPDISFWDALVMFGGVVALVLVVVFAIGMLREWRR